MLPDGNPKFLICSVFLRALEYYSGIIFLTTNRVDLFDRAILDRTILIVRYDPLSPAQRGKIRENCLRRLEEDNSLSLDFDARKEFEKVDNDKDYDWDGREIVQGSDLDYITSSTLRSDKGLTKTSPQS